MSTVTTMMLCKHLTRHIIQTDINWNNVHVISNTTQIYRYWYVDRRSQWPPDQKAWVCNHLLPGIVGSNPAGGMDVFLFECLCCQVEVSVMG